MSTRCRTENSRILSIIVFDRPVEFQSRQDLELLRRLQGVFLQVTKSTNDLNVLLLRFYVDRQRNRAQPIFAICQFRSIAEFRQFIAAELLTSVGTASARPPSLSISSLLAFRISTFCATRLSISRSVACNDARACSSRALFAAIFPALWSHNGTGKETPRPA